MDEAEQIPRGGVTSPDPLFTFQIDSSPDLESCLEARSPRCSDCREIFSHYYRHLQLIKGKVIPCTLTSMAEGRCRLPWEDASRDRWTRNSCLGSVVFGIRVSPFFSGRLGLPPSIRPRSFVPQTVGRSFGFEISPQISSQNGHSQAYPLWINTSY